jgi:hypothetical protein
VATGAALQVLHIVPSHFYLIRFRGILDVSSSRSVLDRVKRFRDIVLDGRDTRYHGGEGIAADRILEHSCEFGISIGDVPFGLDRICHYSSQQTGMFTIPIRKQRLTYRDDIPEGQ